MSAKIYGTSDFSMLSEAGMFVQGLDVDFNMEEVTLPNESGEDVAGAYTNPSASITMDGFVNTAGAAFSSTLGASLTINNALDAASFITGIADDDAGETITTSVKLGYSNKNFKSLNIGAIFRPHMGSLVT